MTHRLTALPTRSTPYRAAPATTLTQALTAATSGLILITAWLSYEWWSSSIGKDSAEQERKSAWALNDALLSEMAHWRKEADSLERDRAILLRNLEKAGLSLSSLTSDSDQMKRAHASSILAHENKIAEWVSYGDAVANTLHQTRSQLTAQQEASHRAKAEAAAQHTALGQRIQHLSEDNASLGHDLDQQTNRAHTLQSHLSSAQSENSRLSGQVSSLNCKVSSLQSEVSSLRCQLATAERTQHCCPRCRASY